MGVPLTCWRRPVVPAPDAWRGQAAAVNAASRSTVLAGRVGSRLRPNHAIRGGRKLCGDYPVMGRHRKTDVSQSNTMKQYTTAVPTLQRVTRVAGSDDRQSGLLPVEEPSRAEILAAI
ncbi:hypothetical protein NDU88_005261 [Pleurodeles waltl]|uniref:Uncharacterized protein n=1 Tax=Pleurodeles waltl TaxID=8319 RepID=A0AAV7MXU2_PLEWA|nr:hypothetical protein NDU88_005261 [Pleurodeles waltl]